MNFRKIVGEDVWDKHMRNLGKVQDIMREAQQLAEESNSNVANAYNNL